MRRTRLSAAPALSAVALLLLPAAPLPGPPDAARTSPATLAAQERDDARLGRIHFPNSGAAEAQEPFLLGVLLLHSFEYEDAARAFREAQEADRDFALAYWGEAMTHNHPLWREQDRAAARAVLGRYHATGATPPTERERRWLAVLDELYADEGSKEERDQRYRDAMRRLQEDFPEDAEARAFHALAILGSTNGVRDFATYMRAAATAQPVFQENPRHPGATHYIIHSFDDPVHAPLGLPAARAYAGIAPGAAHAQHMTSHIFVAMGMWDDVVEANVRARDVQNARRAELGRGPNPCGHYTSWLHYGWLMQGRPEEATAGLDRCMARIRDEPTAGERAHFVDMRARQIVDLEEWHGAERWSADFSEWPELQFGLDFADAFAAFRAGEHRQAEEIMEAMRAGLPGREEWSPRQEVAYGELEGLRALARGDEDGAVAHLREAAALEASLPFAFGPPANAKPPRELLGEVLLEVGRPVEAVEAFRSALERTPRRTLPLRGLARAADRAGMSAVAADADAELAEIWSGAEPGFETRTGARR
jgi:tetratricopeptide (TPR) repeat protein